MRNSPAFMPPGLERDLALAQAKIKDLEHEVDQYRAQAQRDIKSSMILSDKKQATEIKFRQLKGMTRAMRKMGKQMGLAARYMAQRLDNVDPGMSLDLKFVAQVLEGDYWGHEVMGENGVFVDIGSVKASDMIKQTQAYARAVTLANGEDAND